MILGLSAFYHDSAAALVIDGQIIASAQEERFSRKKNDDSFPTAAINYCLNEAGVGPAQIDAVVFYEKPFLKFERLLETYLAFAPGGFKSFSRAMPIWLKTKTIPKALLDFQFKKNISPKINWKKKDYFSANITCRMRLVHFSLHLLKRLRSSQLMAWVNGQQLQSRLAVAHL